MWQHIQVKEQTVRENYISPVQERLASIPGRKEQRISAWLKKAHHCAQWFHPAWPAPSRPVYAEPWTSSPVLGLAEWSSLAAQGESHLSIVVGRILEYPLPTAQCSPHSVCLWTSLSVVTCSIVHTWRKLSIDLSRLIIYILTLHRVPRSSLFFESTPCLSWVNGEGIKELHTNYSGAHLNGHSWREANNDIKARSQMSSFPQQRQPQYNAQNFAPL